MSGNNNTITAADAIITLTVNNLYPSGVQLQGFAADIPPAMKTCFFLIFRTS
ncbi:hypothetical protein R991_003316 [Salmonella enterica]|nr:hypothetical protein [Salmonella enterica]